jgi:hypothetical protein
MLRGTRPGMWECCELWPLGERLWPPAEGFVRWVKAYPAANGCRGGYGSG